MLVYKYVVPERIDILTKGCIRFTQTDGLNDPFETNPCFYTFRTTISEEFRNTLRENHLDLSEIEMESMIQDKVESKCNAYRNKIRKEFVVLSLTKKRNNLVMWSHYADEHRGFVIGLDSNNPFFSEVTVTKNTTPLSEVIYVDERVNVPEIASFITMGAFGIEEYGKFLGRKALTGITRKNLGCLHNLWLKISGGKIVEDLICTFMKFIQSV